jgi:flagellar hook assembly protein FlgD
VVAPVRAIELAAPTPNPAPTASRIAWGVPAEKNGASVDLSVFDLSGRRVRTLEHGSARAGRHSSAWDLRDARGARVDAGVFFVRLELGGQARSQKLIVVK